MIDTVISSAAHYSKISNLTKLTSMHNKSKKENNDKQWTTSLHIH